MTLCSDRGANGPPAITSPLHSTPDSSTGGGVSLKWRLEWRPTLRPDCRLEANHKMFLFVLAEAGAGHPRRVRASGRAGGRVWPAMMEWVCAPRQMCVSVTDAFRVSGARRVADTWRSDISPSRRCSGTYFVSINVRSTTPRAGEEKKRGGKEKTSRGDNKVVRSSASVARSVSREAG